MLRHYDLTNQSLEKDNMTNNYAANPPDKEGETDTKSTASIAVPQNQEGRERGEKEESSTSTGSDGGKGNSGGSGGYNADCSSSDSSSNNDAATRVAEKQKKKGNTNAGTHASKGNDAGGTVVSKSRVKSTPEWKIAVGIVATSQSTLNGQSEGERGTRNGIVTSQNSISNGVSDTITCQHHGAALAAKKADIYVPQWSGITAEHPMDPRIDLSTVGLSIGSSQFAPFATNGIKTIKSKPNSESIQSDGTSRDMVPDYNANASYAKEVNDVFKNKKDVESSAVPSPEQYTKLLESVRPFFSAHGITTQISTTSSNEPQNTTKSSTNSNTAAVDILKAAKDELAVAYASASAAIASREDDENEKDSSSMVVLARQKRKHSTKQEGTDSNRGRSDSSSGEELQLRQHPQHPLQPQIQEDMNYEDGAANENEGNDQAMIEHPQEQEQQQHQHHQQQNIIGDAQHYGFPTMVSEYSSSARNGSSGASNTNMMSASGSGSGGNTGSGSNQGGSSGSGNDQGGSSGSGNDQGVMSSNGNKSFGSGNDKGSSEEIMCHNMEIHSAENSKDNSDRGSPKTIKHKAHLQDISKARFSPNPSEPSSQRRLSTRSNDTESQNAAREKKLQDKKRKRMNMRRVYEDQMEQDMGSSDSNNEQGVLCPGKPVTLDIAISFTTTAKLVVKSSPSLTVIYANAAYIRLSGIDSHTCVGDHIASFLSLPIKDPSPENFAVNVDKSDDFNGENDLNQTETDSKNHVATEAVGRARAAASVDDNITDELEKLIVASGYGKLIQINIRCKPHKMLRRSVKVFKSMVPMKENQGARCDGSSITSNYDGPHNFVACTMSISPVVSSPEIYMNTAMTNKERKGEYLQNKTRRSEKEHEGNQQNSKRRKHHHTMNEIVHNRKRQVISHYVIQLEPHEENPKSVNTEKGSHLTLSNNVEAGMIG